MQNAPTEEFATVTVVNAIASLDMKEKVASELLAQMIARVMGVALTFRTCHMRQCLKTMRKVTSSKRKQRHSLIISGMDPRREGVFATQNMETLTAQRECASMALMSWTRDWI